MTTAMTTAKPSAITNILVAMGRGDLKLVAPEAKEARMLVCKACENYYPLLRQCKVCHCLVDGKTWLATAHCPDSKW